MEDSEYLNLIAEGNLGEARKALDGVALSRGALKVGGRFKFYHGSRKSFTKFRQDRFIYLTTSRATARSYATDDFETGESPDMGAKRFGTDFRALKSKWESLKERLAESREGQGAVLFEIADFLTEGMGFESEYRERKGSVSPFLTTFQSNDDGESVLFAMHPDERGNIDGRETRQALDALSGIDSFLGNVPEGNVYYLYAFAEKPLRVDASMYPWDGIPVGGIEYGEYSFEQPEEYPYETITTDGIARLAEGSGYDCVVVENVGDSSGSHTPDYATDVILTEPKQAKSANLVTFDDDGNVIPLSKRFSDSDDIREQDDEPAGWLMEYAKHR